MAQSTLSAHTFTAHRRPSWTAVLPGRTAALIRQREQDYRCSLIYKLPIFRMLGASARYSRLCVPVETSTPPQRRGEIRFTPFPAAPKTAFRSFAPPSPHWTRSAGLQRGPPVPSWQRALRAFAPLWRALGFVDTFLPGLLCGARLFCGGGCLG